MATTTTTTVNLRLTGKDALYFPLKTFVRLRDTVSGTTYAGTTYVDGDGGATILAVPFAPPTAYYTEISPTGTGSWTIVDPTTVSAPPFAATAGTLKLIGPPNLTPFTVVADDFFASNPATAAGDLIIAGPYPWIDVRAPAYGAKCDGQFINNGVMNGTTAVLTSASNPFVAADVGKIIRVAGAGAAGGMLSTTIASYQGAGQVTLAAVSQTAVNPSYGIVWGTDDTAAWNTLFAAVPNGANVLYSGFTLITAALTISKAINLKSAGFGEQYGTVTQSSSTQVPGVFPYINGSAFVPCTAGQNGLNLTGTGVETNFENVCIRFADGIAFLNTGHGVYAVPTLTNGAGHDNGLIPGDWDEVAVFGHDGNHYAFYFLNSNLGTFVHLRGYGGGGIYLECDSPVSPYGNHVFVHPYFATFCGGTANGTTLKSRTQGQDLNLIDFIRPQNNIISIPSAYAGRGITTASSSQYTFRMMGFVGVPTIGIYDPDLESNFSCPLDFQGATVQVPALNITSRQAAGDSILLGGLLSAAGTITLTDGSNGIITAAGSTGDLYLRAKNVGGSAVRIDIGKLVLSSGTFTIGDGSNGVIQASGTPGDLYLRAKATSNAVRLDFGDVLVTKGVAFWAHAAVASQPVAITAPTAPSAGYVQAEAQSMKTAVDAIRAALSGCGLTA